MEALQSLKLDACDDILSCISALDEVIAEFDDPISIPYTTTVNISSPNSTQPPFYSTAPGRVGSVQSIATSSSSSVSNFPSNHHVEQNHMNLNSKPRPASQTSSKPTFSRLITTLSTNPQEPSVTIMQKESQTVTKIQIGSSQVNKTSCSTTTSQSPSSSSSCTSTSSSFVSTPAKQQASSSSSSGAVSAVSWKTPQVTVSQNNHHNNNNNVTSNANHYHHYTKRQQQQQPSQVIVHLKQSDFSPVAASGGNRAKKSSSNYTSNNIYQDPDILESFVTTPPLNNQPNNNSCFTNYELIFPKSPNPTSTPRNKKIVNSEPSNNNKIIIDNNNSSECVVGAPKAVSNTCQNQVNESSSFPKIKTRSEIINNKNMESQSVKIHQMNNNSTPYKPLPASFANNNLVIVNKPNNKQNETKGEEDSLKEHWNFLSDENLPRSLRKTRKVILDDDENELEEDHNKTTNINTTTTNNNVKVALNPVRNIVSNINSNTNANNIVHQNNNGNIVVANAKNVNHINTATAAVRKIDDSNNIDPQKIITPPVRNQKKLKMLLAAEDDKNILRQNVSNSQSQTQQQQLVSPTKDPPLNRPHINHNTFSKSERLESIQIMNRDHINGKDLPQKQQQHYSMFFPLTTTPEGKTTIVVSEENDFNNRVSHRQQRPTLLLENKQQAGNITSQPPQSQKKGIKNNDKNDFQQQQQQHQFKSNPITTKNTTATKGTPTSPSNVVQLDVDDGYLSMINRHDPPIIWPETFIESETFTPEELKKLSSMQQHALNITSSSSSSKSNKLMSSLTTTTSEEKTDYFSDDSLENEPVDEAENLHLSYVIARQPQGANFNEERSYNNRRKSSKENHNRSYDDGRNLWRNSHIRESPIVPSSPVKRPCAFFIPLDDSSACQTKTQQKSTCNSNVTSPVVETNKNFSCAASDVNATKEEMKNEKLSQELLVSPIVNRILENVMIIGVQEASAIHFLLSSSAQEDELEEKEKIDSSKSSLKHENSIVSKNNNDHDGKEETIKLSKEMQVEYGSSKEIYESTVARTSQYEADCEDEDDDDDNDDSKTRNQIDVGNISSQSRGIDDQKIEKQQQIQQELHHDVEFVEDFDQPPPFIPAPPPVPLNIVVTSHNVPKKPESVITIRSIDNNTEIQLQDDTKNHHYSKNSNSSRNSIVGTTSSSKLVTSNTLDKMSSESSKPDESRNKIMFTKSYHRSVDPEIDYRMKMHRQASRSHENLLDIKSRQQDFLTPKRSHGQSCTLPPNTVPPLNQRRHSTFRQFLGGIFKRNKKSTDFSSSGDVPDSPFEDIQFSFGRKSIFPTLPEDSNHDIVYHERKISFSNSPHGSQRSTRSTPIKKSVLSRIFRRKEK